MGFRSAFVGLLLIATAQRASADQPPLNFSDPNITMPYSGGSHPFAWGPKYTTDSYAWSDAERSLLQRVALQRTLDQRAHQQELQQAMQRKNSTLENNHKYVFGRIMRAMQKPLIHFVRAAKPIRIEPLPFVGVHAGPGIARRLPKTPVEGGAPTFARLQGRDNDRYSFDKDGSSSFSFGGSGSGSFSFGSSLRDGNNNARPLNFDLTR
jgi:hypothetical protein